MLCATTSTIFTKNNNCTSLLFFYDSSRAARSAVHLINCFVLLCLSAPLSVSTFLSGLRHSPTIQQNQYSATAEDGGCVCSYLVVLTCSKWLDLCCIWNGIKTSSKLCCLCVGSNIKLLSSTTTKKPSVLPFNFFKHQFRSTVDLARR